MHWDEIYRRLTADRGDPQAWRALGQHVRAWARANLRGRGTDFVEEAVADVCAGVATAFHRAHGPETFHGFVLGHALNVRRTLLNGRRTPLVDIEGLDRPAPEPISSEFEVQDFERLRDALGDLPDRERQALGLRYFDELSAAQIARALGVSEVNARRIVFNGLRRLRQRFQVPRGAQPRKG